MLIFFNYPLKFFMISFLKLICLSYLLLSSHHISANNSDSEDSKLIKAGKEIYKKRCSNCHGNDAQGKNNGFFLSPNLKIYSKGHDRFIIILKKGYGRMPAWGGMSKLSDSQLNQLASYIKHISLEKNSW
ncbi:MAG: hypothetical protein CBC91_04055 [Rickettsiales bacterium TMED131]|nr:MAG: hypothetical protein CBC91_04055 [Rickettsiales bacterium TMED131]